MRAAPVAVAFREVRHFQPEDCLHVEPIAVRGRMHDWTIPAHRHEGLHQFQWLSRGGAEVDLDGRRGVVRGPVALLIAPRCAHAFAYKPQSQGVQVSVPTPLLARAFSSTPMVAERLATSAVITELDAADVAELDQLFAQLSREFERDAPGRVEALRSWAVLIALWFARHPSMAVSSLRSGARDALVQRFRTLAQAHWREHRPLAFYARALKVTPDHLSRVCRATTGLSALDHLHERVAQEARRLLAYTEMPVAQVAHEVGFAEVPYFSRFFTRRCGVAPSAYRQRAAEGRAAPAEPSVLAA
jgi:AraC family transcriptional activator of pobA